VPTFVLRAMGLFNPTMRELLEMQYLYAEPFVVDSTKIATRLGARATPTEQALSETLAAYRAA